MSPSDFLRTDSETKLCERFLAAGAVCSLRTNSQSIVDAARGTFLPVPAEDSSENFSLRFWVDEQDPTVPPWPKPYVRGLDHLVFAGFGSGSALLADLRIRRVIGRFAAAMATDSAYWRRTIFPILMTILSPSVGIAELHCACVARGEDGLLLAGSSGSGKSTLALALAQTGLAFLSDDRTFCSVNDRKVFAWGLPTRLKLRKSAAAWFRELMSEPSLHRDGEGDLWVEPEAVGLARSRWCHPRALVILEQQDGRAFRLSPVSPFEAIEQLSQQLIEDSSERLAKVTETITRVAKVPCWRLQYGGPPRFVAEKILAHFLRDFPTSSVAWVEREGILAP